jgi:topoisomerase IA-like protein
VSRNGVNRSLPAGTDIFSFTAAEAEKLLSGAAVRPSGKELGKHPDDGKPVIFYKTGKYGPYVAWNRVFVSVYAKEGINEKNATLEWALSKLAKKRRV